MELKNIFATISTILAVFCTIPYLQAILNKSTKPHQFTWLVYFIMNGIVFFSQYLEGARQSVLISLCFFVGSFFILLLSLKYGVRNSSKFDKVLFGFALITIVIWLLTRSNSLAIWLTILIDISATSMMMLKIKADPDSENPRPWVIGTVAYVFTCLTLLGQPIGILYVRPFYGLLSTGAVMGFIYLRRLSVARPSRTSSSSKTLV